MARFYTCKGCDSTRIKENPHNEAVDYCVDCVMIRMVEDGDIQFIGGMGAFLNLIEAGSFFDA